MGIGYQIGHRAKETLNERHEMKPELGVCYYPEHWPEERWQIDAAQMAEIGITWVRIGEFAWSRLEPTPDELKFDWLDRAIEVLGQAGLKVVLGTPTATPPRWMVTKYPDMLPVGADGAVRKFGSRRHYCFSHLGYRQECRRITRLLGKRYGANPYVKAWQIDNEYGCHDTTRSYSDAAGSGFRDWLAQKYQSIDALNRAWGNVFWSMEYGSFEEINLPNLTVTEPNPAHLMAFRRYSSDQVVEFNKAQADELRRHTNEPLIHNYMGRTLDFDHYAVGNDLDIASWDSYPLGFLSDRLDAPEDHKLQFLRQGDPDFQAFHHDLYRCVGNGRWWVMEQQPGPVNWAPVNPAPAPGMVRLWSWEAIAHGAEVVSYFRWRQLPFGQEQMHAGLLNHDATPSAAMPEIVELASELKDTHQTQSPVALIYDYPSAWTWETQPQGEDFDYFALCFSAYRALRRAGLSIDIVRPNSLNLSGYKLVLAPGLATLGPELQGALQCFNGVSILGPRTGSKTEETSIPRRVPDGISEPDVKICFVESLQYNASVPIKGGGAINFWLEHAESEQPNKFTTEQGDPVLIGTRQFYLAGWPDEQLWNRVISYAADQAGLIVENLPDGVRYRDTGAVRFIFNYGAKPVAWRGHKLGPAYVMRIPMS